MNLTKIFPFRKPIASPRLRLLCLPYAGGAASLYRSWINELGTSIEVCPVELPGRGVRMAEPPLRDMTRLVDSLADAIELLFDGVPMALFGHSMGARISFELACRFPGKVVHLFASGSAAPDIPPRLGAMPRAKPIAQLSDAEFQVRLRELGGTPSVILDNEELMVQVLPVVRADFILVERYRAAPQAQINAPITALRGMDDHGISIGDTERWQLRTTAAFRCLQVPGGHFFLDLQRELVTREILRDLGAQFAGAM
jgi:medium-chain acyl-[acyl-carrier-protein] hydrolase